MQSRRRAQGRRTLFGHFFFKSDEDTITSYFSKLNHHNGIAIRMDDRYHTDAEPNSWKRLEPIWEDDGGNSLPRQHTFQDMMMKLCEAANQDHIKMTLTMTMTVSS